MVQRGADIYAQCEGGFKYIADLLTEPIWIAEPNGTVVWFNQTYRRIMGVNKDVIYPEDWGKLLMSDDIERLRKNFGRRVKSRQSWKETFGMKDRQGQKRWFIARADPVFDGQGNLSRWVGVNTEITHEKETEEKLKISQERYELASMASEDVIWDWNLQTNKVEWNQAISKKLDHHLERFSTDISWWDRNIHPDDHERVAQGIQQVIEAGKSEWRDEYRFKKGNGEYAIIKDRGYIIFDRDKKPLKMIGSMRDVTWERTSMERLREAKAEADRANHAKSTFLANVSHEVRTPLTAILGYVELLRSEELDKASLCDFVSVIERNGQHVLRILDDVLDLAKVESGALRIHEVPFNLDELARDMRLVMESKARKKNIGFELSVAPKAPKRIISDPVRARQVITNLAGNAIKFTERGKVQVKIDYAPPCLRIQVKDTGVGISPGQRERIFEPFNQGDHYISREYGGSGLGLALARRLCEAMHGHLALLKSELGKGSVFEASFEVEVANGKTKNFESNYKDSSPLKNKRILVVDDSADIRLLVQRLLGRTGAKVDAAASGKKGTAMALKRDYDMILLDIQMPKMDGYATLKKMRQSGVQAPVVALTAHAMKEDREKALRAGFTSFVTKPMRSDRIASLMQDFSSSQQPLH